MRNLRELIEASAKDTFDKFVKNDYEYVYLENRKSEIINELKINLNEADFCLIEKLINCFEEQNFITAKGFSFARILESYMLFSKKS